YESIVRKRVEKYFFDTPPTGQTVDKSTFIEGGMGNEKVSDNRCRFDG
ncbi:hypothetical protein SAMN05443253_1021, partial [Bacillus sp. OK048]